MTDDCCSYAAELEQRCLAALDYMHRVGHRYQMAMLRAILAGDGAKDLEGMNTGGSANL